MFEGVVYHLDLSRVFWNFVYMYMHKRPIPVSKSGLSHFPSGSGKIIKIEAIENLC